MERDSGRVMEHYQAIIVTLMVFLLVVVELFTLVT